MSEGELELGAQERKRRPQLVTGVGHEFALALEGVLQTREHCVQRLAEPLELVSRPRDRQALPGRFGRDCGRSLAHRLDRTERQSRQEVPRDGCQRQSDRTGDEKLVAKAPKRLGAVRPSDADDEDEAAATPDDR
jgi:hypothetical protein